MMLSNAVLAAVLAVVALCVSRTLRQPAVCHALWVLVLVKLITPPLWQIPVGFAEPTAPRLAEPAKEEEEVPFFAHAGDIPWAEPGTRAEPRWLDEMPVIPENPTPAAANDTPEGPAPVAATLPVQSGLDWLLLHVV